MDQFPPVIFGGRQLVEFTGILRLVQRPASSLEQHPLDVLITATGAQQFRLANNFRILAQADLNGYLEVPVRTIAGVDEVALDPEAQRILLADGNSRGELRGRAARGLGFLLRKSLARSNSGLPMIFASWPKRI